MTVQEPPSTRPYLIRALHEWCSDNGFTPYLVVHVDNTVQVPHDFVNQGEIVLNASYDATQGLQMGNDFIAFKARFGGKPHDIMVPVDRVAAIYARENGQGMAFPVEQAKAEPAADTAAATAPVLASVPSSDTGIAGDADDTEPPPGPAPGTPAGNGGGRPSLRRIK